MDKQFNRQQNKTEYFFSNKEKKQILSVLVSKKFKWYLRNTTFQAEWLNTTIEIKISQCAVFIYNKNEVCRILLKLEEYQNFILSIQDMIMDDGKK